jgi:hypothetical protein
MGGYWVYQTKFVQGNLMQELNKIDGVNSSAIEKHGNHIKIKMSFDKINDLRQVYLQAASIAAAHLKSEEFTLLINDRPNQELKAVWEAVHLSIYQALAHSQYEDIKNTISIAVINRHSIKYRVQMDWENIYVQLYDEENYLYQVIPRLPANQPNIYQSQGSEQN